MEYKNYSTNELIERIRELEKDKAEDLKKREASVRSQYFKMGYMGPWHWNQKHDVLTLHPVQREMFVPENASEKILFDYYLSLIHENDRESVRNAFDRHLEGKEPLVEVEYRILFKDGDYHWLYHHAAIDEVDANDCIVNITGTLLDVTSTRENEVHSENEKIKLERKATTDFLTNLLNRRGFNKHMNDFFEKSVLNRNLTIAMFDIDNFKQANDAFGHEYGGQVLRDISSLLEENTRETDILSRFGGDEFLVVFTNTPVNTAYGVCERIRKTVQERYQDEKIKITLSGGVKEYTNEHCQKLVDRVDKLLYRAKNEGKNKLVK